MARMFAEDGSLIDRKLSDEDVVSHQSVIRGTTLEAILKEQGKPIPAAMAQSLEYYDYFLYDFQLGAKLPHGYKGVDAIEMDFDFISDSVFDVEDGLPKPEWVETGANFDVDVGIVFKHGFKFLQSRDLPPPAPAPAPTPGPGPTPSPTPGPGQNGIDIGIRFGYKFSPKVEIVRPSFAGNSCQLILRAKPGQSVDSQDISLIAKLDKRTRDVKFRLTRFRVKYRRDFVFTDWALVENMMIPVDLRR